MRTVFLMVAVAIGLEVWANALTPDVVVVGGGSAGFGAAWNAARLGLSVVLVERGDSLGGVSVSGGVSNWEPDCSGVGTPRIVYKRLRAKGAAGVYVFERHCLWDDPRGVVFPGGYCVVDPALDYDSTLRRHGPGMKDEVWFRKNCHGVLFNPDALADTMREMLDETRNCRILLNTSFVSAEKTVDGTVRSIMLSDGSVVRPKIVIDACGAVCRSIGCKTMTSPRPNGATLVYRVAAGASGRMPEELSAVPKCWWGGFPPVFAARLPCGDVMINMLPTITGREMVGKTEKDILAECRRRVFAQWAWIRRQWPAFENWHVKDVCREVAYRETFRIEGEYVLTGTDVRNGLRPSDEIACSDHPFDSHDETGFVGELAQPYGVPYRCLLPKGTSNVLIVGRCASFDAAAASSCRLSRTMMQLGEAAGLAAHAALRKTLPLRAVRPQDLERPVVPSSARKPHRRFVLADESRAKVHLWDSDDPESSFSVPVEKPVWDLKKMREGVYRIVCRKGYMIVDLLKRKVVETFRHDSLDEVTAICDLPDGGLICSVNPPVGDPLYRKAVLIRRFSAQRTLVATYRLDGLFYARSMNPDRNPWHFLLAWEHGFVRYAIDVKRGICEVVQSYPQPVGRNLFDVELDLDGRGYWASIGYGGELIHFATDGTMLSRWRNPARSHFFAQMREMPNGSVYMAQWTGHGENDSRKGCQVLQFDSGGKLVWELDDPERFGSVSGIDVLIAPELGKGEKVL